MIRGLIDHPGRVMRLVAAFALLLGVMALVMPASSSAQDAPTLKILSPTDGELVTTDNIEVQVEVDNFSLNCQAVGAASEAGQGHIHALLDGATIGALTGFYCQDTFTISGVGVAAGKHTLTVVLAENNYVNMMDTAQQVNFEFQPANVQPMPEANDAGVPTLELVSPSDGATVSSVVSVELQPTNFTPDADLEGKANVPGYGHYHVFVDMGVATGSPEAGTPEAAPEGSIPNLVLMPGTNSFDIDLTLWGTGEHTITIMFAQNDHSPIEGAGQVEFKVIVQ